VEADRGTLERDIRLYYAFSFLLGTYIASGVTVLFERELGLSFSQIFVIEAFYMLTFILFEVPSGALADLVGRKKTVVVGTAVIALAAVATGLSTRFWQVLACNFIWAFGFSCISGAAEAMLYDRIADETRYAKAIARSGLLMLVGAALGGVVGPWLFSLNFRYPYLWSAVPFALAGGVIVFFNEQRQHRRFNFREHLQTISTGARVVLRNRAIRWSSLLMALLFASSYTMASAYQPYLRDVGFSLALFSVIVPATAVISGLGDLASPSLSKSMGETLFVVALLAAVGGSVLWMALVESRISLAALLIFMFFQGVAKPFLSVYANREIASDQRATVLSVQAMVATTAASLPLFVLGLVSDRFGLDTALLIMGLASLVFGAALAVSKPRSKAAAELKVDNA
jgi:MFS family permease